MTSRHCAAALSGQVSKSCTQLDLTFFYISQIRTEKYNASARRLLPRNPARARTKVGSVKIAFELLPNNWFVSTKKNSMKCFVNWNPGIRTSFEQTPTLNPPPFCFPFSHSFLWEPRFCLFALQIGGQDVLLLIIAGESSNAWYVYVHLWCCSNSNL